MLSLEFDFIRSFIVTYSNININLQKNVSLFLGCEVVLGDLLTTQKRMRGNIY